MDSLPLVSIICLCYNQKPYVRAALESALTQTYPNIELIIVDDASTDGSQEEITQITNENPDISFVFLNQNIGNCKAFNMAFQQSKGQYIIDLAADDILLPVRVELGVKEMESAGAIYGIHFSDAFFINDTGKILDTHYTRNKEGLITSNIPQGNVYAELIKSYFINPPTMMIKREVFESLGGYDETLNYEDFDFWIRSSRTFHYLFNKAPLVKKRIIKNSLSSQQNTFRNKHQLTTYRVCQKIFELNQSSEEDQALVARCKYEVWNTLKRGNIGLALKFLRLGLRARNRF